MRTVHGAGLNLKPGEIDDPDMPAQHLDQTLAREARDVAAHGFDRQAEQLGDFPARQRNRQKIFTQVGMLPERQQKGG